jgi:hypothetical protein
MVIDGLKRMFAASQADAWEKSRTRIHGSMEYDLAHDRRPLDTLAENIRAAERKFNDAEHEMTVSADPFSGTPWPADYAAYETAKRNLARARQAYEDGQKSWNEVSQQHLANARPYAEIALHLDSSNRLVGNQSAETTNWVVSATDARALCSKAAQYAKDEIDRQLGTAWERLVLDLRAWRDQHIGKIDAETISKQLNKTAEIFLLLEQDATLKRSIIDSRVKNFNEAIDGNQAAVIEKLNAGDPVEKSAVVDLMRERYAKLTGAISDINDQSGLAASIMAATVNESLLVTPRVAEPPVASDNKSQSNPNDYAGKLSFYDTRSGNDVLIGTKDLGVTTIAMPKHDAAAALPPDSIVSAPLTPAGTPLKLVYAYDRLSASSYPTQNEIAFTTQQTKAQKQAEKDFTKYGGSVSGLVRAGEYGYVRFNNSQFVKDKLPTLSRLQTPMMPFHQPVPATVQFATRSVSIASDFTRGAMYLESAANKVAKGEDPTSDYVAAGAAFAQGTIDSSVGLYVDATLVAASQYKADNPQIKPRGKPARPLFPESPGERARGISYEYRPDGSVESAQRIDPHTGELQEYTPTRDEFVMRNLAGDDAPSTLGVTSIPTSGESIGRSPMAIADSEIQSAVRESASDIVQSAERVARAYAPLHAGGLTRIDTSRARMNALATELRENADRIKNTFQKFSFDVELNRASRLGGSKWSIPGGVKLMAYASAGLIVPALVEYGIKLSGYMEKATQGTATTADDVALAASTAGTVAMITPYIPVVGPAVTPFLLLANMVMNAAAGSLDKSPVEKVAAQFQAQTTHPLANLSGYAPIVPPASRA